MIQQVLNRRTLRDFLDDMKSETTAALRSPRRRASAKTPLDEFLAKDLRQLLDDIRQATKDLNVPARIDSQTRTPSRATIELDPVSDFKAYIPQSPVLSNLQAAIEEYFRTQRPDTLEAPTRTGRRGGLALQGGERISIWKEHPTERRLFGEFEQTDVRWVSAKLAGETTEVLPDQERSPKMPSQMGWQLAASKSLNFGPDRNWHRNESGIFSQITLRNMGSDLSEGQGRRG